MVYTLYAVFRKLSTVYHFYLSTFNACLILDQSLCFRLGCPDISEDDLKLMNDMAYWLEGVIQTGKIYVNKKNYSFSQ